MMDGVRELFAHAAWADAELYRVLSGFPPAHEDPETRARLHHAHVVQHLFLQAWKGQAQQPPHPSDFPSLAALRNYAQLTYELIAAGLEGFPPEHQGDILVLPWFQGEGMRPTVAQALHHVLLHSAYHRGQTAARLRALGGEPPQLDYIVWIWKGKPEAQWS